MVIRREAASEQRSYRSAQSRFVKFTGHRLVRNIASLSPQHNTDAVHQSKHPHTFRPFDEFDFSDFLSSWFSAENVKADDSTCLLKSLHSLAVCHLPHINIIHKEDAVIHTKKCRERQREGEWKYSLSFCCGEEIRCNPPPDEVRSSQSST